ncbi:MAG: 30S ribosomal protein S20 [Polyangiaceae bacterium]|jgi:small subunit ribosomal protein S20|nr:30S ribosomal protein S20 [Polyangiaceae bacterium]MBK8942394.1 30S ribosomal protein S20 [Polyangiaceae bacterium]
MANHASAEKRNRQRITRTVRNRAAKSTLRTVLKRARTAAESGAENAAELVRQAQSELDRAAKKGVIPTERADRVKGRLASAAAAAK